MIRSDQLSPGVRIRRDDNFPKFVQQELEFNSRYPHTCRFPGQSSDVSLCYRKSRWGALCSDVGPALKCRTLFAWLEQQNQRVGAIHLVEYRFDDIVSNDDIFFCIDAISQNQADLAEAVLGGWEDFWFDVACAGNLLEFRSAWADPAGCPHGTEDTVKIMAWPDE